MRTGIATMTLDYGRCPAWLFERMVRLARVIVLAIISEFGSKHLLQRLADPVWFQSLGTLLAFDWNASGLTITTTAALKEALRGLEKEAGLFICGGKGKTSRKTPEQILHWAWKIGFDQKTADQLIYTSRITAKVDSALIQDGFTLYHHTFFFNKKGEWTVVQQGMNTALGRARRYHWSFTRAKNFLEEPHTGIASERKLPLVLNLTSRESRKNKEVSLELLDAPKTLYQDLEILSLSSSLFTKTFLAKPRNLPKPLSPFSQNSSPFKILSLPGIEFSHHPVEKEFLHPLVKKSLEKVIFTRPTNFESLLMTPGVGAKTIRALSLVAEVIYGAKPSYEDPARYSFSFGGKDGTPYPVEKKTYDQTLAVLEKAVKKSRLFRREKETLLGKIELFSCQSISSQESTFGAKNFFSPKSF